MEVFEHDGCGYQIEEATNVQKYDEVSIEGVKPDALECIPIVKAAQVECCYECDKIGHKAANGF